MNKKQEILERKYLLRERAVFDSEYRRLMADLKKEEMRLDAAEMGMTHAQRDAMWDFFDACSEVEERLLELALEGTLLREKNHG